MEETDFFDQLDEIDEQETIPFRYSITSYGADFPVQSIVSKLRQNSIVIPKFQRGYVWPIKRASRFIESLLLGLPVPGVFLSRDPETQELLVVDGQQRLQTLRYFYDGIFEPTGRKFTLNLMDKSGKNPWQSEYHGMAYTDLKAADQLRLDDSILHATIIRQDEPEEDVSSAVFDIFERLNTETDELRPQEIRTCVYWGEFSEFLSVTNELASWRDLLGRPISDKRMRDQELLLRFFALFYEADDYTKPMKRFLNGFMKSNRHMGQYDADTLRDLLEATVEVALREIGTDGFKRGRNFNAAIFDSVSVAIARRMTLGPIEDGDGLRAAHKSLLANSEYDAAVSLATSDEDSVATRLRLATQAFKDVV